MTAAITPRSRARAAPTPALEPVRAGCWAPPGRRATALRAEAAAEADRRARRGAQAEAAAILAEATAQGAADGAAAGRAPSRRGRGAATARLLLAAERQAYEELRARRPRGGPRAARRPRYPALRERLARAGPGRGRAGRGRQRAPRRGRGGRGAGPAGATAPWPGSPARRGRRASVTGGDERLWTAVTGRVLAGSTARWSRSTGCAGVAMSSWSSSAPTGCPARSSPSAATCATVQAYEYTGGLAPGRPGAAARPSRCRLRSARACSAGSSTGCCGRSPAPGPG